MQQQLCCALEKNWPDYTVLINRDLTGKLLTDIADCALHASFDCDGHLGPIWLNAAAAVHLYMHCTTIASSTFITVSIQLALKQCLSYCDYDLTANLDSTFAAGHIWR